MIGKIKSTARCLGYLSKATKPHSETLQPCCSIIRNWRNNCNYDTW